MNISERITKNTNLEANDSLSSFDGFVAQQNHSAYQIFHDFLNEIKPKRILEIGTGTAGFTRFLQVVSNECNLNIDIRSYDIVDLNWYEEIRKTGVKILNQNIFIGNFEDIDAEVKNFIQSEGTTIILCDGGKKKDEFNLLANFMKPGDFIMAHDFSESLEVFQSRINHRVWNWCEITESDIMPAIESCGLKNYKQELFETAAWVCKKKEQGKKVTIVTALWNLGRGSISESFSRKYDEYLNSFSKLLETDVNMYIFCDPSDEDFIWKYRQKNNTTINKMTLYDLLNWFEFTNTTNEIRKNDSWLSQAGWLRESPQATLEGYNPLVMSKMFMLNNVTIWNPFDSDEFFWIDAGITNTVNQGYFTHDKVFDNLPNFLKSKGDFIFLSYPYIGNNEIHGFERTAMAKYSNTDYVEYVCRGGFFGGTKEKINELNGKYYWYLSKTLSDGFMGTEESIFTILAYNEKDIYRFEIPDNGLIWPFFEELKNFKNKVEPRIQEEKPISLIDNIISDINLPEQKNNQEVALYVIGFNSPEQFKTLIHSMVFYDKDFIEKPKKYLLNNSTDLSTTEKYQHLCDIYGFEHIKKDNIGITGGRQWIAEHFNESNHRYYMFFEDDMFFSIEKNITCRNGFNRYTPNLFMKVLRIMKSENFHYLKFNFSEFFGDNGTQWSWYNVPQVVREAEFPEKTKLPQQGLDPDAPRTIFKNIKSLDGLSYVTGDVYYSNWPQIMSKEGNRKCFIDTKFQFPYEQTIMSFIFQETRKGNIKPALLLLTPTEHNRFEHYDASLRKEC